MFKDISNLQIITWGLIAALFIWLLLVSVKVGGLTKTRRRIDGALRQDKDLTKVISGALNDIDALAKDHKSLRDILNEHRALIGETIRHVAVVRYDAFSDVGGKLSFSAAFLNEKGDGLVITAINGRSEGRIYAKPLKNRASIYQLSDEELEAINQAQVVQESKKLEPESI